MKNFNLFPDEEDFLDNPTTIKLIDGPLQGQDHQLEPGFPVPDSLSIPDKETQQSHWYETVDNTEAVFLRSEPLTPAQDHTKFNVQDENGEATITNWTIKPNDENNERFN